MNLCWAKRKVSFAQEFIAIGIEERVKVGVPYESGVGVRLSCSNLFDPRKGWKMMRRRRVKVEEKMVCSTLQLFKNWVPGSLIRQVKKEKWLGSSLFFGYLTVISIHSVLSLLFGEGYGLGRRREDEGSPSSCFLHHRHYPPFWILCNS